jgi:hypothetical protein
LRVADTLDEFAVAIARNIGMEEEGRTFNLLRQLVEEWKRRSYSSNSGNARHSENELLFRLDLTWRVRRLYFLTRLIDDILLGLPSFHADEAKLSLEDQEQRNNRSS